MDKIKHPVRVDRGSDSIRFLVGGDHELILSTVDATDAELEAITTGLNRAQALRDQVAEALAALDGTHPAGELADPASFARDTLRAALVAYEAA